MNGGSMTTFSRITMAAAAALLMGLGSAKAADLGGNCCADLEERIAELEATTARKGNRKVSLTISGQISQQVMYWDDGYRSDIYVTGPTASNSRFRLTGTAKISPEVTAGFLYEFESFASQSASVNQANGTWSSLGSGTGDDAGANSLGLREAMAWIQHSRLGKIQIGHGSSAANNAILVDLSGKGMAAPNDVRLVSSGFRIHQTGGGYSNATWGNFFQGGSGDWLNERIEHVAYFTPTLAGFVAGVSWGEDNYWDAVLKYAGEFNGVRIAGALGYSVRTEYNLGAAIAEAQCTGNCDKEVRQLAGSLSIRHMPTGLFFTGAAGRRETDNQTTPTVGSFTGSFFYVSGGVARNFTGLGDTVLYGEYSEWKGMAQDTLAYATSDDTLTHWGLGIVQHVDTAAMELWLAYKNYSLSGDCIICAGGPAHADDLHLITAGTRIRF